MPETDLIWMSLIVFIPSVFALGLLFFPKGWDEAMRWWSLFGTALTLGVSLCVFVFFKNDTIDHYGPLQNKQTRYDSSLNGRAHAVDFGNVAAPARSKDWIGRVGWVPRFNIDYYLGLDGISMALVILTTVICFLSMIASWGITKFVRGYCILFLILETGMLGAFLALDFFLFYIFWEVMLLPMYFLIGIWGGENRAYAAIKFFLYTLLGSVFILIALLAFYFTDVRDFVSPKMTDNLATQSLDPDALNRMGIDARHRAIGDAWEKLPVNSFDLIVLQNVGMVALKKLTGQTVTEDDLPRIRELKEQIERRSRGVKRDTDIEDPEIKLAAARKGALGAKNSRIEQWFFQPWFQYTMFIFLFIGFAIKVPIFPFHTWLPDAHVQAPTPISMILAGVLLKLGGYGILRIAYPICPWAAMTLAWWIALLGVINIVYGAFAAMAQADFKKLVAYSSISHMGYVILGIAVWSSADNAQYWSWGMNGAMFQMIAHGITSAGMFFMVGVIYDRAHHRRLDSFGGLNEPMPLYTGLSAVIFFAAMGLPGMCGFVGEFMVVLAAWKFSIVFSVLAAATVVITAAYILWTVQRVFLGTNPNYKNLPDIGDGGRHGELVCAGVLVILSVLFGILPAQLLLNWMEPSVTGLVDSLVSSVR